MSSILIDWFKECVNLKDLSLIIYQYLKPETHKAVDECVKISNGYGKEWCNRLGYVMRSEHNPIEGPVGAMGPRRAPPDKYKDLEKADPSGETYSLIVHCYHGWLEVDDRIDWYNGEWEEDANAKGLSWDEITEMNTYAKEYDGNSCRHLCHKTGTGKIILSTGKVVLLVRAII